MADGPWQSTPLTTLLTKIVGNLGNGLVLDLTHCYLNRSRSQNFVYCVIMLLVYNIICSLNFWCVGLTSNSDYMYYEKNNIDMRMDRCPANYSLLAWLPGDAGSAVKLLFLITVDQLDPGGYRVPHMTGFSPSRTLMTLPVVFSGFGRQIFNSSVQAILSSCTLPYYSRIRVGISGVRYYL